MKTRDTVLEDLHKFLPSLTLLQVRNMFCRTSLDSLYLLLSALSRREGGK